MGTRYLFVKSESVSSRASWALVRALPDLAVQVVDLDANLKGTGDLLQPKRVPCLYDPPVTLYESHAILRYLGGGSPFYADDLTARAKIDEILDYQGRVVNVTIQRCIMPILFPALFGADTLTNTSEMIVRELPNLYESLRYLQARLKGIGPYLNGSRPTIADLSMAGVLQLLQHRKIAFDLEPYPEIKLWLESIQQEKFWVHQKP